MKIDPVKFGQDLNHTMVSLERLLSNRMIQHAIGDSTAIQGMMDALATVQGFVNDPVAWPKYVDKLNDSSP